VCIQTYFVRNDQTEIFKISPGCGRVCVLGKGQPMPLQERRGFETLPPCGHLGTGGVTGATGYLEKVVGFVFFLREASREEVREARDSASARVRKRKPGMRKQSPAPRMPPRDGERFSLARLAPFCHRADREGEEWETRRVGIIAALSLLIVAIATGVALAAGEIFREVRR
jgi:hypothetical protein